MTNRKCENYSAHRKLWKEIFGDTDQYIEFYFREKAARSKIYSKYEGNTLASMAFFTPYEVVYCGKECVCPCIVGVATRPEYRHRGYMRSLLEQGLREAVQGGSKLAFLTPADEKIYEPLGFRGVQYRTVLRAVERCHGWYTAHPFIQLEQGEKEQAAQFAAHVLRGMRFDLYRKRSAEYYEMLDKEVRALDGGVIVLKEKDRVRAVASYIYEDQCYEVTEVICCVDDGQKVLESVCAYLMADNRGGGAGQTIVFSDGECLGQVSGAGITREKERMPYIMMRDLKNEPREIRAYINDIT